MSGDGRTRRERAYKATMDAVLAYIQRDDATLYDTLEAATDSDALGVAYRLAYVAAQAVAELAERNGEQPERVLHRLLEQGQR